MQEQRAGLSFYLATTPMGIIYIGKVIFVFLENFQGKKMCKEKKWWQVKHKTRNVNYFSLFVTSISQFLPGNSAKFTYHPLDGIPWFRIVSKDHGCPLMLPLLLHHCLLALITVAMARAAFQQFTRSLLLHPVSQPWCCFMRDYTSFLSNDLECEGSITINLSFLIIPPIFPKPPLCTFLIHRTTFQLWRDRRSHHMVAPLDTLCRCFINCEPNTAVVPWLEDTLGCVYHASTMEYLVLDPFSKNTHQVTELTPAKPSIFRFPSKNKVQNLNQPCLASAGRTLSMSVRKTRFWLPVTTQVSPHSAAI